MLSDLAVTTMFGSIALVLVGALMVAGARLIEAGRLPFGGRLSIRTKATRTSPEALLVGNQAAAPFLQRYGVIVIVSAIIVLLVALASDIAALCLYVLALVLLVLGVVVCLRKADAAARRVTA